MCKWGGFSKTLPLAKRSLCHGVTYCPHFLAGPIGLFASAHCLAAAGGDGLLEIDANFNPIREFLVGGLPIIKNGIMTLPDMSGTRNLSRPRIYKETRCYIGSKQ